MTQDIEYGEWIGFNGPSGVCPVDPSALVEVCLANTGVAVAKSYTYRPAGQWHWDTTVLGKIIAYRVKLEPEVKVWEELYLFVKDGVRRRIKVTLKGTSSKDVLKNEWTVEEIAETKESG